MTKQVEVACYGVFRNYIPDGKLRLNLEKGLTVHQVKHVILKELQNRFTSFKEETLLMQHSVLGANDRILQEHDIVDPEGVSLALLPPVSGG